MTENENNDWSHKEIDWEQIEGVLAASQEAIDRALEMADKLLVDIEFTRIMFNEDLI